MKDKFWIHLAETIAARKYAGSGSGSSHRGRRGRQARPLLDTLEDRCLLSFGSPSLFDNSTGGGLNAAVTVGDVSGDTIPDLVTATSSGVLSVAFGHLNPVTGEGDGTFDKPVIVSTPAVSFSAVKLADLNGDGLLDIIAADPVDNEVWVLLNGGGGRFGAATSFPTGSDPVSIAVAGARADLNGDTTTDLNGDGHADIVTANQGDNTVSVLLGDGKGAFATHVDDSVGLQPVQVALGDFNKDGYPDLVTANKTGNSVSVLLGNGDGTYRPGLEIPITVPRLDAKDKVDPTVSNPSSVAVGDFNGDGNLDLVTANSGQAGVTIVFGNGDGSFGAQQTINTLTYLSDSTDPNNPDSPTTVVAADLDGNGTVDIAFSEPKHTGIGVLSGNGDGSFATRVDDAAGESPAALVVANLNGDTTSLLHNRFDLVAVDPSQSKTAIFLGQKYAIPMTLGIGTTTINWGTSITVTPGVTTGYTPPISPVTGAFQLTVDGNPYGVPQPVGSTFVISGLPVGPNNGLHTLGAQYLGDLDYDAQITGTVIIKVIPDKLTLTALDQTRLYGDLNPALTYSITGFIPGDFLDQAKLSGAPVLTTTALDLNSPAGIYPIAVTLGTLEYTDSNYTIDTTQIHGGKLTVQPAPLTIAAANLLRLYGQQNPKLVPAYSGFVNGETLATSDLTGTPTLSTPATALSSVVPIVGYPIFVAKGSLSSSNYAFTFSPGTLIIQPAVLTVNVTVANNAPATRVYGGPDPAFTTTITGFVNGETAASGTVAGTASISNSAKSGSPVGTYPVTPGIGTLVSTDYTFAFQSQALTITPAVLTVAALDSTRAYGITNTTLSYSLTGFANGETAATGGVTGSPLLSTTAQGNSSPGTYAITILPGTLSATDYTFQGFQTATLTITQAALIVQALDAQKSYGAANPVFTYQIVREDQPQTIVSRGDAALSGEPVLSSLAVLSSPQGSYPITVSPGTLATTNSDYYLDFANSLNGTLTITQATVLLTVAAVNTSRPYGSANPTLTYTISGFVNGETLANSGVSGAPVLTTTCTTASPAGYYPITLALGTLQATNYTFVVQPGTLTVTPAALTVTALDQTRSYGDVNPGLSYSIAGFVNGDFLDQSELSGAPVLTTTARDQAPVSGVGVYTISIAAGTLFYANSNYTFDPTQFHGGKLTITPVPLTISTSNLTRPYGQSNPALKLNYTGFVNGETLATSDLIGAASVSTTASASSPAGSYTLVVARGSLLSSDYTLTFQSKTLSITPVALLVTAANTTRVYGAVNPVMSDTITGFVNNETLATSDLTGAPSSSTTATSTSKVGSYPITSSGGTLQSTNYTFTFQPGTLTVTPAILTVAAVDATRAYGISNPVLPYSLTGFANGETAATGGVTGLPLLSTIGQANSPVGPYSINVGPGSLSAANYTFQGFQPATLTIIQAALVVQVQSTFKSYGTANPLFTSVVVREDQPQTIVSAGDSGQSGSPVLSTSAGVNSPVGVYPITVTAGNLAIANPNYDLDLVNSLNGTLTITPATLVITANRASRAYGSADPAFTYTISGFIIGGSDDVTGQPSFKTTSVSSSHVGPYTVVPNLGSLASQQYSFVFVPAEFDVTPAPLTIAVNNTSQSVGADPRLSASYFGLVNGDTAVNLATPAILTTTATSTSLPGTYPIAVSGATSSDYNISFVPGTLTVVKSQTTATFTGPVIRAAVAPPVVFVVRVNATGASSVPLTGVVRFYDGTRVIADAPLVNGTATLSTSALAVGNHSITAVYQGDTNYAGSSAGPISQMVYSAAPAIRASRTAPIHRPVKKKIPPLPRHPAKKIPLAPPPKQVAKVVVNATSSPSHLATFKPAADRKLP